MGLDAGKPVFVNNKGADQPGHPRSLISTFVSRFSESIIFWLVSVVAETGLRLALSETLKTGFLASRPKYK